MENAAIQPAAASESGPRQWCNTAEQAPSECALDSAVASERLAVARQFVGKVGLRHANLIRLLFTAAPIPDDKCEDSLPTSWLRASSLRRPFRTKSSISVSRN